MITYVDTSTLPKLIVEEAGSDVAEQIWTAADALVAVSLIEVEARAALAAASGRVVSRRPSISERSRHFGGSWIRSMSSR